MFKHSKPHDSIEDAAIKAFRVSLAEGDEIAFKRLIALYQAKLFRYINAIVKSREVSEELVLDIFLKIWNAKEMMADIQNLDAFLYRMAVNKALDFLRAAGREKKLRDLLFKQMDELRLSPAADDAYRYKEYEQQLRLSIAQLPPQQQLVFLLSRDSGLSHEQIADQLSVSKHTVKNHMGAAIKKLSKLLKVFVYFF